MNVYFVRHGQSEGNSRNLHQHPEEPLTKKGHEQAQSVAERFKRIEIDIIIASSNIRAHDTAKKIEAISRKPLTISDLFVERRGVSELTGTPLDTEYAKKIHALIKKNAHKPDWHHSDEENFHELRNRAKKALDFLISQEYENIAVITHGTFLRMLLGFMIFGDGFTPNQFARFREYFVTRNTGITQCLFNETDGWHMLTWNDHYHLG